MEVVFFDNHLEDFISHLEKRTIAKVLRTVDLLDRFGNQLGLPHSRAMGGKLFELRIRGMQEVRILYTFHHGRAVLLHGLVKKTQALSQRDVRAAQQKLVRLMGS